ncbi:phage/plasmid replication domain-containing protein [Phocaeicola sp.]
MFDTIKFVLKESDLDNCMSFIEEIPCLISIKSSSSNRVMGYLDNMRVEVRGTTLIVEGSLSKYFKGYNYAGYLSIWEIKMALNKLSNALNISMGKARITRIDVGFCFCMKHLPWVYLNRLLYCDGYFRSNIKKETLYFDKHDLMFCFYDKKAEMKKNKDVGDLEDLKDLNVLRYEFRFKKVATIFRRVIRGEDLYDSTFCLLVLDKWYNCYMDIQKGIDMELSLIRFDSKKAFELSCVACCMGLFNLSEFLEIAFERRDITSKKKYDIKEVMKMAEKLMTDNGDLMLLIDELTQKISNAYRKLRRSFNISPQRLAMLADRNHSNI